MSGFAVKVETLDLMQQLAERQGEHVAAISAHLESHTTLNDVGGLIMLFLSEMYNSGRDNAVQGFEQAKVVCESVAERAGESKQAYLDADEELISELERIVGGYDLDVDVPRPGASPSPELGPATGGITGSGDSSNPVADFFGGANSFANDRVGDFRTAGGLGPNRTIDAVLPRGDLPEGAPDLGDWTEAPKSVPSRVEDWYWDTREQGRDVAEQGSGQTLRDQFNQQQYYERYVPSYNAGYEATSGGASGQPVEWVENNYTQRTWRAGQDVAGAYTAVTGAYNGWQNFFDANESYNTVQDIADAEANTGSYDWATGN